MARGFQMFAQETMSNVPYRMTGIGSLIRMVTGLIMSMKRKLLMAKRLLATKSKIEPDSGLSLNSRKEKEMVDIGLMIWRDNGSLLHIPRSTT